MYMYIWYMCIYNILYVTYIVYISYIYIKLLKPSVYV